MMHVHINKCNNNNNAYGPLLTINNMSWHKIVIMPSGLLSTNNSNNVHHQYIINHHIIMHFIKIQVIFTSYGITKQQNHIEYTSTQHSIMLNHLNINPSLIHSFASINHLFVIVNYYVTSKTINFHKFQYPSILLIHYYEIAMHVSFPTLQTAPHLDLRN